MNAQRHFVVPSAILILVAAVVFSLSHYKRSNAQQLPGGETFPFPGSTALPSSSVQQRPSTKFAGSRVTLERVTYTLPTSVAESLKNLLEDENLTLIECKLEAADDDEEALLMVTTNPTTQRTVELFLQAIIKTKPRNVSNPSTYLPSNTYPAPTPPQSQQPGQ